MVIDSDEFEKLVLLLKSKKVPFDFYKKRFSMGDHYEICIPSISAWQERKGYSISINCLTAGHKDGLLEFWDGFSTPVGNLTAHGALETLRKAVKKK